MIIIGTDLSFQIVWCVDRKAHRERSVQFLIYGGNMAKAILASLYKLIAGIQQITEQENK